MLNRFVKSGLKSLKKKLIPTRIKHCQAIQSQVYVQERQKIPLKSQKIRCKIQIFRSDQIPIRIILEELTNKMHLHCQESVKQSSQTKTAIQGLFGFNEHVKINLEFRIFQKLLRQVKINTTFFAFSLSICLRYYQYFQLFEYQYKIGSIILIKIGYMQEEFENQAKKLIPQPKCIKKNVGFIICREKQCNQPGIMCYVQKCECRSAHKRCENQIQIVKIIDNLVDAKKQIPKDVLKGFELILKNINDMIDQLSLLREQIANNQRYFGLSKSERQFYCHLLQFQFEKLNGKLVTSIKQQIKEKQKKKLFSSQDCEEAIKQQRKKFEEICKNLNLLTQPNIKAKIPKSKITDDFATLQQWIVPSTGKPIKQFRLLYRGSQNDYSAVQFHKKCDSKYNTLVLVRTNYGKVIGGFSPYRWNQPTNSGSCYYDSSHKTFLFSLTSKQKITQITTYGGYSICGNPSYGPTFGGAFDLHICDKSNTSNGSYGNLGYSFNNGNFTYGAQQTNTAWTGCTNGSSFITEQYEIYQVIV